jgi:hypothetical protein
MLPRSMLIRHAAPVALVALAWALAATGAHAQLRGLGGGSLGGSGSAIGGIGSTSPGVGGPPGPPNITAPNGSDLPRTLPAPSADLPVDGLYGPAGDTLSRNPVGSIDQRVTGAVPNTATRAVTGVPAVRAQNRPRTSRVPPVGEQRFVNNEVLLGLPSGLSAQALDALASRHRLTRLESQEIGIAGLTFHRWRITDGRSVAEVVRSLEAEGRAGFSQPNYRYTLQQDRSAGRLAGDQYALAKLQVPEAHRLAAGGKVLVAVIDNGIDTAHPELAGAIADRFDAAAPPEPPSHHGTGMAGAIVAHAQLVGVAPEARILAVRAFSATGGGDEGTTLSVLKGIDWAVTHGARVISMSFAGPRDPEISLALSAAAKKGVVLVAAAGNAGSRSGPLYPAADPNVIAVTATDAEDHLFVHSNRGGHIALAAPGVDVLVPAPNGTYQLSTGTSVAAAQISGIAALMLELNPRLKPAALKRMLLATARDLGPKGRDDLFGAGLADAYRAAQAVTASAARPAPTTSVSAVTR